MIERTTLPEGWTVAAFCAAGNPTPLWISIEAPGLGTFTKLCTKDNEERMWLALRDHADRTLRASAVLLTEAQRDGLTVKRDVNIGGAAVLRLCASSPDGDCEHANCPQLRDGEPAKTGRHCPLDLNGGDDE